MMRENWITIYLKSILYKSRSSDESIGKKTYIFCYSVANSTSITEKRYLLHIIKLKTFLESINRVIKASYKAA